MISMEKKLQQPICGEEALNLINCVTETPFDEKKCLRLLQSLRDCVLAKKVKKFWVRSQDNEEGASATKRS